MNNQTKLWGVSLMIFAFSISINANAQTCTPTQDCNSLGYLQSSSDCVGVERVLKCPFDKSKMYCIKKTEPCEVGSILYSDKNCSKTVKAGKTAIGIVFDTNKRLAIALDQVSSTLPWSARYIDIPGLTNCSSEPLNCGTNGKANTNAIIAYGKANSISYPAAEYCNRYTTAGTTTGDWFLPSYEDLKSIYNAKNYVNASLQLLGKSEITENWYWSSTELSSDLSWLWGMGIGNYYRYGKDGSNLYDVRAVVAF